ncbi:TIGR00268 family protein [Candidatus Electronema sp. PJ]|uniref:ATP-dependent sacrificial sulfur transferase LarE n=1 Tax=Candidatus Electronema sp. PJ TaxID=3401572 RepID=UPI003AA9D9FB
MLHSLGKVGIAFSGGVDSSFLLRAVIDTLGADNVLVLHARSCLQSKAEQEQAVSWLKQQGFPAVRLRIIDLQPLEWEDFIANPPDRCYLCKRRIYSRFLELLVAEESVEVLLDGTNLDDLQQGEQGRPGLQAVVELGVRTPLADCCLSKAEIREVSRELGLETWNQPSGSCLATRIPQGMKITAERLAQIAALEEAAAECGFQGCRVRLLDETKVCLQLCQEDLDRFCLPALRQAVCDLLNSRGAGKIFLDLDGR